MVDHKKLELAAYAMERAYKNSRNLGDAVHSISNDEDFKDLPDGILSAMWHAIDAYVDLNT